MQNYTKEAVIEAYNVLKTAKSNDQVKLVDNFLKSFQKSREAWAVSQEILLTPSLETHMYLQLARTLKHKIEYDFAQLPAEDYLSQAKLIICKSIPHSKYV